MLILGLTGNLASGKNLVAKQFEQFGAVVFDADLEVHKILNHNQEVFAKIQKHFPTAISNKAIDRKKLGDLVFGSKENLELLEKIIHPIVKKERERFIKKAQFNKKRLLVLNIPLLFEKEVHRECHASIFVSSPRFLQKQRFLNRAKKNNPNFKEDLFVAKFENILQNQIPVSHGKILADFVINNGQNKAYTFNQVKKIFNQLISRK